MSDKYEGLRRAAENALTLSKDYPWPQNEILVLPPFCVSRVFIAKASPEVVLSLLQEHDQLLAEKARMTGGILDRIDMAPNDDPLPYIREYVKKFIVPPYSAPKESK